jgi:predicted porin
MSLSKQDFRPTSHPLAWALGLAFAASPALAQESPWYIGASLGFKHDSNVFRTLDNEKSETATNAGVLAGLDIPFGRQRFFANGAAQTNRHKEFKELDNTSYSLTSGLDLQTVEHLSGGVRYSTRRNLAEFGLTQGAQGNIERSDQLSVSARWGILSYLGIEAGAERRELQYTVTKDREFTQDVASAGLIWGTSGVLTLKLGVRATKGDFPQTLIKPAVVIDPALPPIPAVFGPDETDRKDIDLTAVWSPTGISTLTGRLSKTRETHSEPSFPTLSAWTGGVTWDYKPGGRLSFTTSLSRDTGSNTTFIPSPLPGLLPDTQLEYNRINTVFQAGATYELTGKIVLNAAAVYRDGDVSSSRGGTGTERSKHLELGVRYRPTRTVSLGCNVGYSDRPAVYTATVTGCSAEVTLR